MMENILAKHTADAVTQLYGQSFDPCQVQVQKTRKEFEGDFTIVVFPFTKASHKGPEQTASEIGEYLQSNMIEISHYGVVKGFLNIVLFNKYWIDFLYKEISNQNFGVKPRDNNQPWIVEFSSPNTNKPLHLGHIRNNLLGWSVSSILEANGKNVVRVNLVNDRGIHICKSMLAWKKWGNDETPENSGKKGDHLVGEYYVLFDKQYKRQVSELIASGLGDEVALKQAPLILESQQMLQKWESGDPETIKLWKMMNSWVYAGFDITYQNMGIHFDKTYFESETYLIGKRIVEEGLNKEFLIRKEDGSVWADLTEDGFDEKLLIRNDGTSVYMTQDLGTAKLRFDEYKPEKLIYVVGNEQNYHFNVLKKVLNKLGFNWSDSIHHLSYGMVELPEGKMKSREGTVVDADDLMNEMISTARKITMELGKSGDFEADKAEELFRMIGLGALKYFILKVDPEKNMLFNPEESVDFEGNTGPFIQYTYARICSLMRKAGDLQYSDVTPDKMNILAEEREVLRLCHDFPRIIKEAGDSLSPALVANYVYELNRTYNTFYQKIPILKEADKTTSNFRLRISYFTGQIIRRSMKLIGIELPEKM